VILTALYDSIMMMRIEAEVDEHVRHPGRESLRRRVAAEDKVETSMRTGRGVERGEIGTRCRHRQEHLQIEGALLGHAAEVQRVGVPVDRMIARRIARSDIAILHLPATHPIDTKSDTHQYHLLISAAGAAPPVTLPASTRGQNGHDRGLGVQLLV
jgi:hypothetical protein